jgi:hypothetical protein
MGLVVSFRLRPFYPWEKNRYPMDISLGGLQSRSGCCGQKTIFTPFLLTELSPSWQAANCAATRELSSILWNPKVHHRVHKSPPLVPILSQIDPVHISSHPISLRSILILSTHLRLGLPSGLFYPYWEYNLSRRNNCVFSFVHSFFLSFFNSLISIL